MDFDGERFVTGLVGDISSGDIQSEHYHRYLFALQFCIEKDVLDVASGEGYGSFCIGQVARSVIGIDSNVRAVEFANANYMNDRVSYKGGSAQSMPIDDASIDVVVSFETLEHFREHHEFAMELRRVLRPGGIVIMSSPNRSIYSEQSGYKNPWHLKELNRDEFVNFLLGVFRNVRMLAQRSITGSVIAIDDDLGDERPEGFMSSGMGLFSRTDGVPNPPFLVAVASDAELPKLRSSLLENPTLLKSIDSQRKATLKAAESHQEELVASAATRNKETAEAAMRVAELSFAVANAKALRANTSMWMDRIRHELFGARKRNTQLAEALETSQALRLRLAEEAAILRTERDEFRFAYDNIRHSTAWKASAPLRFAASLIPLGLRHAMRGRSSKDLSGQGAAPHTSSFDSPVLSAAVIPDRPASQIQLGYDSEWLEPSKRPEFINLGNYNRRSNIAVVVHVYYPEIWTELLVSISNISETFDLFVTLIEGASDTLLGEIKGLFPESCVLVTENHGRDIFPFIALIRTGVLFGYEVICKIHTKRSVYREGGDEWRKSLVDGILGSAGLVAEILDAFRADPDIGLIVAPNQIFGGREFWVANESRSRHLCQRLGLNDSAFERDFAGGSIYWIRPLILRTIDGLRLGYDDFEPEPISVDGSMAHAVERLFSIVCHDAGMKLVESGKHVAPASRGAARVLVVANYLPQFHPIPENDEWWGQGFTEWTNVTKARPQFRGHRQPRLPTDLGFYDLRLEQTRIEQAELARRYGISAFSYYYYWFNGRKLLNEPIEAVVASGKPNFPFMLCWANEPWTRNWDGMKSDVLMPQDYVLGWERSFATDAAKIVRDDRYLRMNGKPILGIYRVGQIPEPKESLGRLRAAFRDEGISDLHLVGGWVRMEGDVELPDSAGDLGLDAYFEFPPHGIPSVPLNLPESDRAPRSAAVVFDYGATVDAVLDQLAKGQPGFRYRGTMMGWDNTARRDASGFVFHGATPANFRRWLRAVLGAASAEAPQSETAVFINAWNEWAEGTYLEPDRDFGTGWLEAVASALGLQPPH
jgi:lipopolysaccharide biosynthesis protein/SAM-dependent methyltransferase